MRRSGGAEVSYRPATAVDMRTIVGGVALPAPILTASGTAGHGSELAAYGDLGALGAVVVKSLSVDAWAGNPAPRVHATRAGMINAVGLQGPGIAAWREHDLPPMLRAGARVVGSIWGQRVDDYRRAAEAMAGAPGVIAVEVNISCPNLEDRRHMFAHSTSATADAVGAAVEGLAGLPAWVKLSPNVADLPSIAAAAAEAGAAAVVLCNTVLGMALDVRTRKPVLANGGGGYSGVGVHPVAVRAVWDVHGALPDLPIVGVGGVLDGEGAAELLLAGASAVEVGTATFAEPRACWRIQAELAAFCAAEGIAAVRELVGSAHR